MLPPRCKKGPLVVLRKKPERQQINFVLARNLVVSFQFALYE